MAGLNISNLPDQGPTSVGGITTLKSARTLIAEQKAEAEKQNHEPVIQGLASHVRKAWMTAWIGKQNTVERRMLASVRQRRGEYEPEKLALLQEQGSATIYMMLTSNKCRAGSSWLKDVFLTSNDSKPWTIEPAPVQDMEPGVLQNAMTKAVEQLKQIIMQEGQPPSPEDTKQLLLTLKDQAHAEMLDIAKQDAERMEKKMQTQMLDGGWKKEFSDFIDDIATFPAAIMKGPIVRKRNKLKWVQGPDKNYTPDVQEALVLEWERVDPFMIYPAPDASTIQDGYLIERHRMSRSDLSALIGVDGYSEGAIRNVLTKYNTGYHDWIYVDIQKAQAEGKHTLGVSQNPSELIDALQYWGDIQGKMLLDWGMTDKEIPDPEKEYPVEVWVINDQVIKAAVNPDPMARRPYYKTSYEEVPGAFWGNSIADLCRDTQDLCNATARALANNMGIASGPQVVYNVDLLPSGENITQMYPWKIWQVTTDESGGSRPPMQFFQPQAMVQELLMVYEKFAVLADEYTGIPRYMTGDSPAGGAGRTASGMSMLMSNAGKSIKQVIGNIDLNIIEPAIGRLYYYNMRYGDDPDLKGDIDVVACGADTLLVKEQAQARRNEFLQITANPIDMQIVGIEGRGAILRESAKTLDMNPDDIVPPLPVLRQRLAAQQAAQAAQQPQVQVNQKPGSPPVGGHVVSGASAPKPGSGGQKLMNGAPVVNNFAPRQGIKT